MALLAPVLDPPRRNTATPESHPFPDVNLLDRLLAEQHGLQTPVANFARDHSLHLLPPRTDLYRHLIPLEKPGLDEQYAFQVELDKCTSCKACVTACHSLNGLDESESWRDIGLLTGGLLSGHAYLLFLGAISFLAGMMASISHLGRPLGAWRFFLGLRTSWLSREILAFSLVPPLFALAFLAPGTAWATTIFTGAGSLSVFTSVMVYHDTGRPFWHWSRTGLRFFGTTLLSALIAFAFTHSIPSTLAALALASKLLLELATLLPLRKPDWSPARHTARLQTGPLRTTFFLRMGLGVGAVALLPSWPLAALALFLFGETLERRLFFQSVYAPRMTGMQGAPASPH